MELFVTILAEILAIGLLGFIGWLVIRIIKWGKGLKDRLDLIITWISEEEQGETK